MATPAHPATAAAELPAVPLTIEGYNVLHQMMRIRWSAWKALSPERQNGRAPSRPTPFSHKWSRTASGQSALFSLLGHKGDLMLVHFRNSFDELNQAELALSQLELAEYLEPTTSYLSVIELGLYESIDEDVQEPGGAWHRAALRCMEAGHQRSPGTAEGGHAPAAVSGDSETPLPLLLPHGPPPRRGQELVHACRWKSAPAR